MRKTVKRVNNLPSFKINLADLEVLYNRLITLFDVSDRENFHFTVTIELSNEKIEFNNLEELKNYSDLKDKLFNFSIFCYYSYSINNRNIFISVDDDSDRRAYVVVNGDSEAWSAGAVETVCSFFSSYKTWYFWLLFIPFGFISLFSLIISMRLFREGIFNENS